MTGDPVHAGGIIPCVGCGTSVTIPNPAPPPPREPHPESKRGADDERPQRKRSRETAKYWVWGLGAVVAGVLVLFFLVAELHHAATFKSYSEAEFTAAVTGKTEAEVSALLGAPDLMDKEPWNSPQWEKRCYGYVIGTGGRKWTVIGQSGGVVLYFSREKGRVDHVEYVPRPQERGGVFIFVRF